MNLKELEQWHMKMLANSTFGATIPMPPHNPKSNPYYEWLVYLYDENTGQEITKAAIKETELIKKL